LPGTGVVMVEEKILSKYLLKSSAMHQNPEKNGGDD
jgi:hypothetical protein